jgi:hypothetical protein
MKIIKLLIYFIILLGAVSVSWCADYSGSWKRDCSDSYGLQINSVENEMYSFSLCGGGGRTCTEPGWWTPNTRIKGDPKYKIISPVEIYIKLDDGGYRSYRKCSNDLVWKFAELSRINPTRPPDCSFDVISKDEGILIAWITNIRKFSPFGAEIEPQTITVGPFRPIALINGTVLSETLGATIQKGQLFWDILSPVSSPRELESVDSFFDYLVGSCSYHGTFGKDNSPEWTLLSSTPLSGMFQKPTSDDTTEFYHHIKACEVQGVDWLEGQEPPCTRPTVLAITDINKNGKPEYWATEPYKTEIMVFL